MSTDDLIVGEKGTVSSVSDGDTLYLDSGLKVRLAAIQAPKLPLGRAGFKAWPLGEESKTALTALVKDKTLQLYYGGEKRDRYGRALAQTFTLNAKGERDIWLQEEMVRLGMARVYTWPDTFQDAKKLYAAEIAARDAQRGIWGHNYYRVRTPEPNALAQDVDSYQIVQGIITSAADVRGQIYLNFGADYKTDFTIAIAKRDRKRFEAAGLDPISLEGATVRIRGWVELSNGPMVWLDHPERLEVLN
ncbi:thermonuclease family protein [Hellea balneolensis]|uniref:thermonuclease family protein n=1 Tax=Hellea balneolensis TaxID=287478 RepID=UPI000686D6FE|nr:thermonuclease family protein [Hellea balneolensis]